MIIQYSIVCQVPDAEPYTVQVYNGTDLSQVLGITQANMPEGYYGWIQECGEVVVRGTSQTQSAYADFSPNAAKRHLSEEMSKNPNKHTEESPKGGMGEQTVDHNKNVRLSQLPPLLIEVGPYCNLLREGRATFVDGHFYACVAMSGISFERFQRDKARPYGATIKQKMHQVRRILKENSSIKDETIELCEKMANLRNEYAHGEGLKPKEDALKALSWMHSFIDNETNLMRNYIVVNGILHRSD